MCMYIHTSDWKRVTEEKRGLLSGEQGQDSVVCGGDCEQHAMMYVNEDVRRKPTSLCIN